MINNIENPFEKAVKLNQITDFLLGQNGYEIRLDFVYMPTDTVTASSCIEKYIRENPNFDTEKVTKSFIEISQRKEWCWIIIFYLAPFIKRHLDFLPLLTLYKNIEMNKEYLKTDSGWIVFNEKPIRNNLWDVIVFHNNKMIEGGLKLPTLI